MKSVNLCVMLFIVSMTAVSATVCDKGCVASCMLIGDEDKCLSACHCGIQRTPTLTEIIQQNACSTLCNLNCSLIIDQAQQLDCYHSCACTCNKVCIEGCVGVEDEPSCKASCGCMPPSSPVQSTQPVIQSPTGASPQPVEATPTPVESQPVVPSTPAVDDAARVITPTLPIAPGLPNSAVFPNADSPQTPSSTQLTAKNKSFTSLNNKSPAPTEMKKPQIVQSSDNFLESEVSSGNSKTTKCGSACVSKCIKSSDNQRAAIDCLTDCGCYEEFSNIEFMQAPEAALLAHGTPALYGYLLFLALLVGFISVTGYVMYGAQRKKREFVEDEYSTEAPLYSKID